MTTLGYMQWSQTYTDRGLNLISHLSAQYPSFAAQQLTRQLRELEPAIVAHKEPFFYWKGAQLFHALHKLMTAGLYEDIAEYLQLFLLYFDNAIFMKQIVNAEDAEDEDQFSNESSCIQELVDDLLESHPEQAEHLMTRVKFLLDMILQDNSLGMGGGVEIIENMALLMYIFIFTAKEARGTNVYNLQLTIIVTICTCIYNAETKINNTVLGSAVWILHLLLTKSPFKTKMTKHFATYDIFEYDANELKTEALKKYPKVANDTRWQIPSNLPAMKFETISPSIYDGTGFVHDLSDLADDEEEMIEDVILNSAHQIKKQKSIRREARTKKAKKSKHNKM